MEKTYYIVKQNGTIVYKPTEKEYTVWGLSYWGLCHGAGAYLMRNDPNYTDGRDIYIYDSVPDDEIQDHLNFNSGSDGK